LFAGGEEFDDAGPAQGAVVDAEPGGLDQRQRPAKLPILRDALGVPLHRELREAHRRVPAGDVAE